MGSDYGAHLVAILLPLLFILSNIFDTYSHFQTKIAIRPLTSPPISKHIVSKIA